MKFQIALPENDEGSEWKKKTDNKRFLVARSGDMLCTPFQCEECWFVNLHRRNSYRASVSDKRLLGYIRRVNLDIMWSRERSTVGNTLSAVKKARDLSVELGLKPQNLLLGPWPVGDDQGFQTAIEMLRGSQREGKNAKEYVQFDTIRKIRTGYSTVYENSAAGGALNSCFRGDQGKTFALTDAKTDTRLFRKFMQGLEKRMGRLVKQNSGIAVEVLLEILENYELELADRETSNARKRDVIISGAAFVIMFCAALRGGEVFLVEASELCRKINEGKSHASCPHVVLPLMGRFKGENGERNLMFLLATSTKSGIQIRRWIERLSNLLITENRHRRAGPAFCDELGYVYDRGRMNGELFQALKKVQTDRPDLISAGVEFEETHNIHRSFRRGATTRAREAKVPKDIVELNNRWKKVERKSGGMPNLSMQDLYTEMRQALATLTTFSESL